MKSYTIEELMKLTKQEILTLAKENNIEVDEKLSKEKISQEILEFYKNSEIETASEIENTSEEQSLEQPVETKPSAIQIELRKRNRRPETAFKNELSRRMGRRVGNLSFKEQIAERSKRYKR